MVNQKITTFTAIAGVLLIVLVEISLPFEFGGTEIVTSLDPDAEAEYIRCYEESDKEMHRAVFAAIDNPDVQKEMISTNRDRIANECRQHFPEITISVERDVSLNLIDLRPRFW